MYFRSTMGEKHGRRQRDTIAWASARHEMLLSGQQIISNHNFVIRYPRLGKICGLALGWPRGN